MHAYSQALGTMEKTFGVFAFGSALYRFADCSTPSILPNWAQNQTLSWRVLPITQMHKQAQATAAQTPPMPSQALRPGHERTSNFSGMQMRFFGMDVETEAQLLWGLKKVDLAPRTVQTHRPHPGLVPSCRSFLIGGLPQPVALRTHSSRS